jgi:transcriptional regulator with XRE-family HTH domain
MGDAQEIGTMLRLLREQKGLSQRGLAERLGVHQPAVARWEAGGVNIPVNRLEEIVGELGYGLEYDLTAVPVGEAVRHGVPVRLLSRPRRETPDGRPEPVVSAGYIFEVNRKQPWMLDIREAATRKLTHGAVAVVYAPIRNLAAHPDGVIVSDGGALGKITPNGKTHADGSPVFTYSLADRDDLALAGVADTPDWAPATAPGEALSQSVLRTGR